MRIFMHRSIVLAVILAAVGTAFANSPDVRGTTILRPPTIAVPEFSSPPITDPSLLADTAFFRNIQIEPTPNQNQSETGIAVNPVNPLQLICSANDFACGNTIRVWYSSDGGLTWKVSCVPLPSRMGDGSALPPFNDPFDPTVAYDSKGNCYICWGDAAGDKQNAIFVARSSDGGATWQKAVPIAENLANVKSGGGGAQPFEDKYYIACDASIGSPYLDNIYVTWTRFAPGQASAILCVTSTDKGATWSNPVPVSTSGSVQGSMPIVGPNGEVYVAWGDGGFTKAADLVFARSDNGGKSFAASVTIAHVRGEGSYDPKTGRMVLPDKDSMRIATFPTITVDISHGAHRGTIYVAWQALNNVPEAHIFLSSSVNNGRNWTTPQVVDQGLQGWDVYMPAIACDPVNGDVVLDYYDSRNSTDNKSFDLYYSISHDGALSFSEYRITDRTTKVFSEGQPNGGGHYFGDYQGIAAFNGTSWPCWWDCRLGNNTYARRIFTAQIRFSAGPVTALATHASCADPSSLNLTWVDPKETTTGQDLVSFTISILRNGVEVGTTAAGVQTFNDSGLSPDSTYTYSLIVKSAQGNSIPTTVIVKLVSGTSSPFAAVSNFTLRPVTGGVLAQWVNPATHVDGTIGCNLHAIYFYHDTSSTPVDSAVLTPAAAGNFGSKTLLLDTSKVWNITTRVLGINGRAYLAGDTSSHVVSFAGAPRINPTYNFDGAAPLMYTTGTWGVYTRAGHSGSKCLADNQRDTSTKSKTSFCQLAPFIIKAPDTTFAFQHILLAAVGQTTVLEISTNNGQSWNTMVSYKTTDHATDWHVSVLSSNWVLDRRSMLSRGNTAFAKLGDTVSMRFRMTSTIVVNRGWYIDDIMISDSPATVRQTGVAPSTMTLDQNYPNPFNPSTVISFAVAQSGLTELIVVDALGRTCATLVHDRLQAGRYTTEFRADDLPSGTYYSILRSGGRTLVREMILLK